MDYNKIYRARYLYKVAGISSITDIAEQTGLSLEMARKAVNDSMADYPRMKQDFQADQEAGDYSRQYELPATKRLKAEKLQSAVDRYVNLILNDGKSLDNVKSLLIADDLADGQINSILKEVASKVSEAKAESLGETAEQLLAIEALPPKFTVNKAMEVVTVFPSPMVDRTGHITGIKYSSKPVNWRAHLPTELRIAVYEAEHPLYIDIDGVNGVAISPDPEKWGPKEFELLVGKPRRNGYFSELADYLEMTPSELQPYLNKARAHVKQDSKVAEAEPVDFKRVDRIVKELVAEFRAKGGNVKKPRKSSKTAVTAE